MCSQVLIGCIDLITVYKHVSNFVQFCWWDSDAGKYLSLLWMTSATFLYFMSLLERILMPRSFLTAGFLVLCKCFCSWGMWPLTVARLGGRCLSINSTVIPGQVVKLLFLMALFQVDKTNEKHAACKYCTRLWYIYFVLMMTDILCVLSKHADVRSGVFVSSCFFCCFIWCMHSWTKILLLLLESDIFSLFSSRWNIFFQSGIHSGMVCWYLKVVLC